MYVLPAVSDCRGSILCIYKLNLPIVMLERYALARQAVENDGYCKIGFVEISPLPIFASNNTTSMAIAFIVHQVLSGMFML